MHRCSHVPTGVCPHWYLRAENHNEHIGALFKAGAVPPQLTAQAYAAYQVIAEATERLNKRQLIKAKPLREVRILLNEEILRGTYNTPLGKISFSTEGEVIQESFFVAQVRMNPDGRSGKFTLLP